MKTTLTLLLLAGLALPICSAKDKGAADPAKKKAPDATKVFAKKDSDGNGSLSLEEFTKGAKDADKATKAFTKKDKDGDKQLSPAEFAAKPEKKKK
jgi:Ca2+-binding EF-hand superfamily protein